MKKLADITKFESLMNKKETVHNRWIDFRGQGVNEIPADKEKEYFSYRVHSDITEQEIREIIAQYNQLIRTGQITVQEAQRQIREVYGYNVPIKKQKI